MDRSENITSSQKDDANVTRLIYSLALALIPAIGFLAASIAVSVYQLSSNTSSKLTSASAVPALGNSGQIRKITINLSRPNTSSKNINPIEYPRVLSGNVETGALQTYSRHKPLSFTDLFLEIRKENKKRLEDAVIMANPNYDPKDTGRSLNCQRCALVFIRLLRGEDYYAYPSPAEDKYMNLNTLLTVMKNPPDLQKCTIKANNKEELIKIIESKMKEAGEGSVGVIGVSVIGWKYGHLFNSAQVNDTTWLVDSQRHLMNNKPLLDSVDYSRNITFFLADDIEFNDSIFDSVIGVNVNKL